MLCCFRIGVSVMNWFFIWSTTLLSLFSKYYFCYICACSLGIISIKHQITFLGNVMKSLNSEDFRKYSRKHLPIRPLKVFLRYLLAFVWQRKFKIKTYCLYDPMRLNGLLGLNFLSVSSHTSCYSYISHIYLILKILACLKTRKIRDELQLKI